MDLASSLLDRASRPPTRRRRAAIGWLAGVVAGAKPAAPAPSDVSPEELALAAELHGVEGWVRRRIGPGNPGIDRAVHAALARHQRALGEVELAAGALKAASVPFLVVKGPALVATCYESADLRSYVDLDLLVRPSDVGAAAGALAAVGFALLDANWPLLTQAQVYELRFLGPSGGALDLHWALSDSLRGCPSPPVEALFARSEVVALGTTCVRTLDPADTVVHLAVHAVGSGGHRLIWLADLRAALARAGRLAAPGALLGAVDEWRARPAVALMLRRTHRTLGVDGPPELRRLLRPGAWLALTALADQVSPPQLAAASGSFSRLVARSCRSTPRDSLQAALTKGATWLRGGRTGGPSPAQLLDSDNPASALHPVGDHLAAERFYQHVAAQGDGRTSHS